MRCSVEGFSIMAVLVTIQVLVAVKYGTVSTKTCVQEKIEALEFENALYKAKLAHAISTTPSSRISMSCHWNFKMYTPSSWEKYWVKNVKRLQDRVCEEASKDQERISEWVNGTRKNNAGDPMQLPTSTFSRFKFVNNCTGEELVDYIEPLAGLTRHPYYCSKVIAEGKDGNEGGWVVNKEYLIASWNVSRKLETSAPGYEPKAFYFDLGASFYASGVGGASQSWFIETYEKRGIAWRGIFAWEATPQDPSKTWQAIPARWKPYYHWYNIPVSSDPDHADNALRYIKTVARPEDYVLLKIDIDHPATENALVDQLLASRELLALVDEIYYEHHVNVAPMHRHWKTQASRQYLADTYRVFDALRRRGVLAHSWV